MRDTALESRQAQEREDEEAARRAFERATEQTAMDDVEESGAFGKNSTQEEQRQMPPPPAPSFERVKKIKKTFVPGLVKKTEAPPAVVPNVSKPLGLGLGDYDDSDDD